MDEIKLVCFFLTCQLFFPFQKQRRHIWIKGTNNVYYCRHSDLTKLHLYPSTGVGFSRVTPPPWL